jgi:hypothetical protein
MNSDDDIVILTGADDNMSSSTLTYTGGPYSFDNLTIDTSSWNTSTITSIPYASHDPSVSIDNSGIIMKSECDIKVGDRSLKEFMDKVEERLNILHPNPKLEDKWNELAELGKRYRELEIEILEKEKMWNILKET